MRVAVIAILLVTGVAAASPARSAEDEGAPAGAAPPAAAEPAPEAQPAGPPPPGPPPSVTRPPKQFPKLRQASLLHKYQLGIAMMPGVGYRGIFPYGGSGNTGMINCGQPDKRVCTGMLPLFLDVQPSFGFAEHWDVLVDLRFGIGTDFTQSHQFAVAPGVRYWVDPELGVKFYATIQGVFDATAQNNPMVKNNDFGVRNANGFMFDVMRNLGFYIQFGETLGFVRWLRFEIDGGLGVQARLP